MRRLVVVIFVLLNLAMALSACDQGKNNQESKPPQLPAEQSPADQGEQDERVPPAPPLKETFDGQPQLSLFPRVGDYQPDTADERYPFWRTFIDHFIKVSGLLQNPETKNKAWSFRGINTIDSVAWFSPVAVQPNGDYRISYKVKAELPEGAKTGIGILEFKEFLWIGEQYTEKTVEEYLLGSMIGIEISDDIDWEEKGFDLRTGPETNMIHLVFYREGEHSRKPVLIDDVEIRKAVTSDQ
ncbi:MAG: hypothetical protein C0623_07965 [Desulfuromonas sp.]|nr:MAG: hypothetical protein C0623_07965 [Desulfuromonas sp.]